MTKLLLYYIHISSIYHICHQYAPLVDGYDKALVGIMDSPRSSTIFTHNCRRGDNNGEIYLEEMILLDVLFKLKYS